MWKEIEQDLLSFIENINKSTHVLIIVSSIQIQHLDTKIQKYRQKRIDRKILYTSDQPMFHL